MPLSSQEGSSTTTSAAEFGANEWLIDEMYERFQQNPSSVSEEWREFFANGAPGNPANDSAGNAVSGSIKPSSNSAISSASTTQASPVSSASMTQGSPVAAAQPTTVASTPAPAAKPAVPASKPATPVAAGVSPLKGAAARIAENMDVSLTIPTATSVRAVPAKLLADNRIVINNHLARGRGGKLSFTHLIGFAMVKALVDFPEMNRSYAVENGKPVVVTPEHVNLGLAIDLNQGSNRTLVVVPIKGAETMDFAEFVAAYEEIVRKARKGKLSIEDFSGTTISLSNPGGIGTVHSVPRLMQGQGTIIAVGAMEYPAEFSGMSDEALADMGVSKVMTLTSTYDHRIIQGAQSGEFLKRIHQLLLGEDGFYEDIFTALRVPYEPVKWTRDITVNGNSGLSKNSRVIELINAYRAEGHFLADTDPLEYQQRRHPDLDLLSHGLTLWDLDRTFPVGGFAGHQEMKLRDVLGVLRDSYCRRVGVEYMHITDPEQRRWIQERVERPFEKPSHERQKEILSKLNAAEAFETFLHTKYVGQKRFSLEGGESVIPLMEEVIHSAAAHDLDEVVIGMAHRGRLNILANIVGKPYEKIFGEFEGNVDPGTAHGSGDVKYHLGAESKVSTPDGQHTITVSLTCNPSHLEAVNPVVEGIARAKQDLLDKGKTGFTVLPLLLHGDAAFAGQGVVAETLNLSQLRGYRTGGTVHVVINNQVGFTTAPEHSRSSLYCTDVARAVEAPIFHVNGDDPEACVRVARLAFDYRQAFKKDVVIDMVCYRRRGHNEGDDPSMTNPTMYKIIDTKRSVRTLYTESLVGRGDITLDEAEEALKDYQSKLEEVFLATKETRKEPRQQVAVPPVADKVETAISADVLGRIGDAHMTWPEGFNPHPRVKTVLEKRQEASRQGGIDWAFGELIAVGSLLVEGRTVRIAGQDTCRGTFSQRHSILVDRENGETHIPLRSLAQEQGRFFIYDSLLSEYAAMGFEYGYSLASPEALVCWEAQFGDFGNGAQTVVDEFISSGEVKWGQTSGVTLLLPHGYEGQGPDHSSGRIERYLQLCAENNMTVANPTTPANYFHLLRRQALGSEHKPLVVFTPKSLLRHKAVVSGVEDFTSGTFQPVIPDAGIAGRPLDPSAVRRVLLCSGKVYYDLAAARDEQSRSDVAILRVEQLYPLPTNEIHEILAGYPNATEYLWVQEEPANQGAWSFMALNLAESLAMQPPTPQAVRLARVSRRSAASPAVGSAKTHAEEQKALVSTALG